MILKGNCDEHVDAVKINYLALMSHQMVIERHHN